MNTVWVLVCDAAKARFFEVRGASATWQLVRESAHQESRSKTAQLVSDRAGRTASEGSSVHHNALAPSSSPRDVEKERFAQSLGTTLDQVLRSGGFRYWVLVAPPHFIGLVDKRLTSELKKHRLRAVDKDMTHLTARELAERLHDSVAIPLDQQDVVAPTTIRSHGSG